MEAKKLGNSTKEQELLRPIALWAADFVEEVLGIFEYSYPNDARPRQAVLAAREFGHGKQRDNDLRKTALATLKAGKDVDKASKYVVRAATLAASVAYTHTDLQTGVQGVRQAQHVLGPIVYAALALEVDAQDNTSVSDAFIARAIAKTPSQARVVLNHLPPQPQKAGRQYELFWRLDCALRK